MNEELKRLTKWAKTCPVEAAMRIEELVMKIEEIRVTADLIIFQKNLKIQEQQKEIAMQESLIDQKSNLIEIMEKEIGELKNDLTGYKISNQSLSTSLDKEIKEHERLKKQLYNFDWAKDI